MVCTCGPSSKFGRPFSLFFFFILCYNSTFTSWSIVFVLCCCAQADPEYANGRASAQRATVLKVWPPVFLFACHESTLYHLICVVMLLRCLSGGRATSECPLMLADFVYGLFVSHPWVFLCFAVCVCVCPEFSWSLYRVGSSIVFVLRCCAQAGLRATVLKLPFFLVFFLMP